MFKRLYINKLELVALFFIIVFSIGLFIMTINEAKKIKHYSTNINFNNIPVLLRENINSLLVYDSEFGSINSKEYVKYTKERVASDFYKLLTNKDHKNSYKNKFSLKNDKFFLSNIVNDFEIIYQKPQNSIRINFSLPENIDHEEIFNNYISFTEEEYLRKLIDILKEYYAGIYEQHSIIILKDLVVLSNDISFSNKQLLLSYQQFLERYNNNIINNFKKLENEIKLIKENLDMISNDLNKSYFKSNDVETSYFDLNELDKILYKQEKIFKDNFSIEKNSSDLKNLIKESKSKIYLYAQFADILNSMIVKSYLNQYYSINNQNFDIDLKNKNIIFERSENLMLEIERSLLKVNNINQFQMNFENYQSNNLLDKVNELILKYKDKFLIDDNHQVDLDTLKSHMILFKNLIDTINTFNEELIIDKEKGMILKNDDVVIIAIKDKITRKYEEIRDNILKQIRILELYDFDQNITESFAIKTNITEKNILYTNNLINIIISFIIGLSILVIYYFIKYNLRNFSNKD